MVKNLPFNAGDEGLISGLGINIPLAVGQLSPAPPLEMPTYRNEDLMQSTINQSLGRLNNQHTLYISDC